MIEKICMEITIGLFCIFAIEVMLWAGIYIFTDIVSKFKKYKGDKNEDK